MDISRAIRNSVDTGKVVLGSQRSIKLLLTGDAKIVVMAANVPGMTRTDVMHYCGKAKVPVLQFTGTSIELGTVCGKPFPISVMCVLEEGNSDILDAGSLPGDSGERS